MNKSDATSNVVNDPTSSVPTLEKGIRRLSKADLVDAVAHASELSKAAANKAVEALLEAITAALQRGDEVALVGFGTFSVRERAARTGRNPQTGDPIDIKATKIPAFKPGKALRDAVN